MEEVKKELSPMEKLTREYSDTCMRLGDNLLKVELLNKEISNLTAQLLEINRKAIHASKKNKAEVVVDKEKANEVDLSQDTSQANG